MNESLFHNNKNIVWLYTPYLKYGRLFNDLHLTLHPGEKLAIVGENGVGKSTLVKLLMRFYDVDSGQILLNGADIRSYCPRELRQKIGAVFQTSNIYAMSFADHLNLYQNADSQTLYKIIENAGLGKVLEKNNAQMTTEVTKEFGLLLFDEPSSALDLLAEYEMTKLILGSSSRSTTIIVAHRLSTIRNADRIIETCSGPDRQRAAGHCINRRG